MSTASPSRPGNFSPPGTATDGPFSEIAELDISQHSLDASAPQDIELVALVGSTTGPQEAPSRPGRFESEKFPERKNGLWNTSLVLVADIVGTGVLGLPGHMAKLGWGLGISALLGCMALNLYTGRLVGRLAKSYPTAVSYGDLAEQLRGPRFSVFVYSIIYTALVMIPGGYMLVLGRTLQAVFYTSPLCLPVASFLSLLCVWPVAQLRSFHQLHGIIMVGNATIVIVLTACMVDILSEGIVDDSGEAAHHTALEEIGYHESIRSLSAVTGIVFAYSGQSIFLEIISEMRKPFEFHKPVTGAALFLFFLYTLISGVGYGYKGNHTPAFLLDVLSPGWLRSATSATLFLHMVVSYQIKLQVICRAAHLRLSPGTANSKCLRGRLLWMFLTSSLLLSSWIISNSVPFFDDCIGIIGALASAPASFGFPAIFALLAANRGAVGYQENPLFSLHRMEATAMYALIGLTVFLMTAGAASNFVSILHHSTKHGGPFSCHCSRASTACANILSLDGNAGPPALGG